MAHQEKKNNPEGAESISPFDSMPGGELIRNGLADLERGIITIPALLVSIGKSRLRTLNIRVTHSAPNAEQQLYDLLAEEDPDSAHTRYNALIRTLISFERAAECAIS